MRHTDYVSIFGCHFPVLTACSFFAHILFLQSYYRFNVPLSLLCHLRTRLIWKVLQCLAIIPTVKRARKTPNKSGHSKNINRKGISTKWVPDRELCTVYHTGQRCGVDCNSSIEDEFSEVQTNNSKSFFLLITVTVYESKHIVLDILLYLRDLCLRSFLTQMSQTISCHQ